MFLVWNHTYPTLGRVFFLTFGRLNEGGDIGKGGSAAGRIPVFGARAGDLQRGAAPQQRSGTPGCLQQAPETARVSENWPDSSGQARGRRNAAARSQNREPAEQEPSNLHPSDRLPVAPAAGGGAQTHRSRSSSHSNQNGMNHTATRPSPRLKKRNCHFHADSLPSFHSGRLGAKPAAVSEQQRPAPGKIKPINK